MSAENDATQAVVGSEGINVSGQFDQEAFNAMSARDRGLALLDQLLGPEHAQAARATWHALAPEFESYVVEFLSAQVWHRAALERRIRSLCTISVLAAMGRHRALELNIGIALNNGATQEEIIETLLHIAPYAGFPACWEGLVIANRIFKEKKAEIAERKA